MNGRERHGRVRELFNAAVDFDPYRLEGFLARECAGDPELRDEVERLLAQDRRSGDCLESSALEGGAAGRELESWRIDETVIRELDDALAGRYRIVDLIDAGGMGAVFRARQERPSRWVAVKVIRPDFVGVRTESRFRREIEVLGRLDHPGIAQVYEAGVAATKSGDRLYFAMELVDGMSLADSVSSRAMSFEEALDTFVRICDAVEHAHDRGVLHRDLKPSNILIGQDGQPKIIDFGVARATDADLEATRDTTLGRIVGTLGYMSPEQCEGDASRIDRRTDVYSLGVVLYELVCGRLPYPVRDTPLARIVRQIQEGRPPRPRSVAPDLDGGLEQIILRAMHRSAAKRYASASDLGEELRRYLRRDRGRVDWLRIRAGAWFGMVFVVFVVLFVLLFDWMRPTRIEIIDAVRLQGVGEESPLSGRFDSGDQCGGALARIPDLDGDGNPELVLGVNDDDEEGLACGAAYVASLDSTGVVKMHPKTGEPMIRKFTGTSEGVLQSSSVDPPIGAHSRMPVQLLDSMGRSVAGLGDLDGAGGSAGAIAVGAHHDDDGGPNRGAVWIFFVDEAGERMGYTKISDGSGGLPMEALRDEGYFGRSLAWLGDLDGSGPSVAALAVGASNDPDSEAGAGAVYVLFLDRNGEVMHYVKIDENTPGMPTAALHAEDAFGTSVAWLEGLGERDESVGTLAVGAPEANDGGHKFGCVWLLNLGWDAEVLSTSKLSARQGRVRSRMMDMNHFGHSLASIGDFDGNGVPDLAVGSPSDPGSSESSKRGAIWILCLESRGSIRKQRKISIDDIDDEFRDKGFGASIARISGANEEYLRLVIGSPGDDTIAEDAGTVWVLTLAIRG